MIIIVAVTAISLFCYMMIAFLVGTVKKNNGIIDSFYSMGYVVVAWISLLLMGTFGFRQILVTILVTIWGVRLSIYVIIRNWGKLEDYRYKAMRELFGEKVISKSFKKIYMLQGLIIFLVGFPVLFVNASINPAMSWLDVVGTIIWIVGFYFEAVGDHQLRKFKKDPNNKGKVMDQGLWKYTQHPNYFGEVTMWWGIFIVVISVPFGFITIFGPILINFMIIRVSGVRLLNKRYEGDDKYADYKKRTSAFIPWFPKKKEK